MLLFSWLVVVSQAAQLVDTGFERADLDGDGKLSVLEAAKVVNAHETRYWVENDIPAIKMYFDTADLDHDGRCAPNSATPQINDL